MRPLARFSHHQERQVSTSTTTNINHQPSSDDRRTRGPTPPIVCRGGVDDVRILDLKLNLEKEWLVNRNISDYVHGGSLGKEEYAVNSQFSVCFLGTGAGSSTETRGSSCTALRWTGGTYLFDVGEGSELRVDGSKIVKLSIKKIFITHMHGDHVYGLPSLLLGMQESAKQAGKRALVQIYGPVGLFNYIASSISLSYSELKHINVEVYELRGGSRHWVHPGTNKNYGEFQHRSLHRRSIAPNQDGTWTLEVANEIRTAEDAKVLAHNAARGLNVLAAQVNHVPKLQCFGYMVQEPLTQLRNIDDKKAAELGLKPGIKFRLLKAGFPVMNDDETRQIQPDEVTIRGILPRKAIFLGDCKGVPLPMAGLCRNADLLVHEATMLESDPKVGRESNGHSTAAMAGIFADYVQARILALNHISPSVNGSLETSQSLLKEARDVIQGPTQVQLTYDRMEIEIPRGGFAEADCS